MAGTRKPPRTPPPASWYERHKDAVKLTRDSVFGVAGLFMLFWETIGGGQGRPLIVGAALALCGLPMALRFDERRNG